MDARLKKNLLRDSIAALRGARSLAYLQGMSRSLCSVRLALKPLATALQPIEGGWRLIRQLSGDDGYERYLAHQATAHPGMPALTRREWFARQQRQKWSGVKRCC